MPNYYPNGATVRIFAKYRVRNSDQSQGALTNPTTVIFSYQNPDGTEVSKTYPDTILRPTTGIYYLDFVANVAGIWRWRTDGDGSVEEGQFEVTASVFSP